MSANRYKYFRWTARTAWISIAYAIVFPSFIGYIAYSTDVCQRCFSFSLFFAFASLDFAQWGQKIAPKNSNKKTNDIEDRYNEELIVMFASRTYRENTYCGLNEEGIRLWGFEQVLKGGFSFAVSYCVACLECWEELCGSGVWGAGAMDIPTFDQSINQQPLIQGLHFRSTLLQPHLPPPNPHS